MWSTLAHWKKWSVRYRRKNESGPNDLNVFYLCFVFEWLCVDEPLFAGSDDYRLLCPPVIRVTMDALLLLQQSIALLQHWNHWVKQASDTSIIKQETNSFSKHFFLSWLTILLKNYFFLAACRNPTFFPLFHVFIPLSFPSVITESFCSSGPANSLNVPSSSTIHSFGRRIMCTNTSGFIIYCSHIIHQTWSTLLNNNLLACILAILINENPFLYFICFLQISANSQSFQKSKPKKLCLCVYKKNY